jgi:Kef-type K+ transport system membrane component KefB
VAIASVAVPTFLGLLGGLWIAARYPAEVGARASPVQFAIAIGICVGVTALPVLGAILRETGLLGRRLGDLALAIAAVNDAALWLLLGGLMMAVAGREPGAPNIFLTLAVLPAYLAFMAGVLPRWLKGMVANRERDGTLSEAGLVAICGIVIGSGMVTQLMGLHYLFGAFVAGAVMPHELRDSILDRLQFMTVGVLMPIFFMLTGLNTLIDLGSTTFL